MYAKLVNGTLKRAPNKIEYNGKIYFNPKEEILLELGYLPVTYVDMPTDAPEGYHYECSWAQTETEILQTWTLMEDVIIEEPPTVEERIGAVEDVMLELLGVTL